MSGAQRVGRILGCQTWLLLGASSEVLPASRLALTGTGFSRSTKVGTFSELVGGPEG